MMSRIVLAAALATALFSTANLSAQAVEKAKVKTAETAKDGAGKAVNKATPAKPSASEVADAKAKGLVWVNTNSKAYHKDGKYFGNTKEGKFMTVADAQKQGYHEAGVVAKHSPAKK